MSSVKAPPTYSKLTESDGKAALPYLLFFDQLFRGDTGKTWTPNFTSLATTGTPTITGRYYQISKAICLFKIDITPATDTTSTAGTTYSNFPLTMNGNGICFAVSGLLGTNAGMCDRATNRIYVPAWSAVTVPLTVLGVVEAS